MSTINPKQFFTGVLVNDPTITFEPTELLLDLGVTLGKNLPLLREVYKAFRHLEPEFHHQPMIGEETVLLFHYKQQTVVVKRGSEEMLTIPQFLQFLGKVDVTFSPIYPLGTTVELDESMLPLELQEMFTQKDELGALVTLTGRKLPLISDFDSYIVDYYGRLWPFGEFPGSEPIVISTMMIKRVVSLGYSDEWEEKFTFDVLRATQVARQQVSTAFMPTEEAIRYYETVGKKQGGPTK